MGIEYYAFALFITGLICLITVLCKVLFSNVKRQHKLLDEKETKLLQLYQTVESIMEEFNDQVKAAMDDINEFEIRAAKRAVAMAMQADPPQPEPVKAEQFEALPRAERIDSSRLKAAGDALERAGRIVKRDTLKKDAEPAKSDNGTVFQRLFDETAAESVPASPEIQEKQVKNEAILALAEEGKTHAEIAKELGITQNEVKLVIDLTGRK